MKRRNFNARRQQRQTKAQERKQKYDESIALLGVSPPNEEELILKYCDWAFATRYINVKIHLARETIRELLFVEGIHWAECKLPNGKVLRGEMLEGGATIYERDPGT
jgi:hypothetical protein